MTLKLTEQKLDELLETLNELICEEGLFNRTERESMVRTVASVGMFKARLRLHSSEKKNAQKKTKEREIDPLFPRHGMPWTTDDEKFLHETIDELSDEAVGEKVAWMAQKLGKTPYAIALKIMNMGRLDKEWAREFKELAERMRQEQIA